MAFFFSGVCIVCVKADCFWMSSSCHGFSNKCVFANLYHTSFMNKSLKHSSLWIGHNTVQNSLIFTQIFIEYKCRWGRLIWLPCVYWVWQYEEVGFTILGHEHFLRTPDCFSLGLGHGSQSVFILHCVTVIQSSSQYFRVRGQKQLCLLLKIPRFSEGAPDGTKTKKHLKKQTKKKNRNAARNRCGRQKNVKDW